MARARRDIARGVYEINEEWELSHPLSPKNSSPFTLKPGRSFDTTEEVDLSVVPKGETSVPQDVVQPGEHYLQIGVWGRLGDSNPRNWRTWRDITVRSVPIPLRVEYSDTVMPGCQTELEQTNGPPSIRPVQE